MKIKNLLLLPALVATMFFSSCEQKEEGAVAANEVSEMTLAKISQLGFSKNKVEKVEGGYLVEGDILLTDKDLNTNTMVQALRVGDVEQYRTSNLVSVGSTARTIKVAVSTSLPSSYVTAVDEAIRRYNAENLRVKFQRVSSSYNILFTAAPAGSSYLASAGFPSGGNPYNKVQVNSAYLGSTLVQTTWLPSWHTSLVTASVSVTLTTWTVLILAVVLTPTKAHLQ